MNPNHVQLCWYYNHCQTTTTSITNTTTTVHRYYNRTTTRFTTEDATSTSHASPTTTTSITLGTTTTSWTEVSTRWVPSRVELSLCKGFNRSPTDSVADLELKVAGGPVLRRSRSYSNSFVVLWSLAILICTSIASLFCHHRFQLTTLTFSYCLPGRRQLCWSCLCNACLGIFVFFIRMTCSSQKCLCSTILHYISLIEDDRVRPNLRTASKNPSNNSYASFSVCQDTLLRSHQKLTVLKISEAELRSLPVSIAGWMRFRYYGTAQEHQCCSFERLLIQHCRVISKP